MPVTVILPNALRPYAAGNDRVPLDAGTAGDVIQKLTQRYPQLVGKLPEPGLAGSAIFRNGTEIHKLQGLDTTIADGDTLTLIVPAGNL
jgi:molybdopterin converting factor small subunit